MCAIVMVMVMEEVVVAAEESHRLDSCLDSDLSLFYYLGLVLYYIFWVIGAISVKVTKFLMELNKKLHGIYFYSYAKNKIT